jgi:large subunit ribosomal protein L22
VTPEEKKDTEAKSPAKKAEGEKPAAKKPAAKKPAAEKPAATKPAAKKETAKTETAEKETAKKPAASKAAAKQPAAQKSKQPAAKSEPKARAKAKPEPKQEPVAPSVRAKASYVRVAPRKARLIADQVRGLPLEDARTLLRFSARTAARDIAKLIDSAAANAENNHDLIADDLRITDITVDEGPTLRRYRPRALGRATRINKRTSHIQVALTPED